MKQPRVLAGRVVYDGVTGKVPGSEELLFPVSEVGMLAGRGSRLLVVDPRAKVIYWTDAKGRLKHKHGLNELRSVEVSGVSLALRFGEARRVYTLVFESFSQLSHFIASVRPFCVVEGEQGPQQQDSAQHNPLRSLIAPDAPDGGPHPPTVAVEELAEDEVVAATTGRFEVTKYSRRGIAQPRTLVLDAENKLLVCPESRGPRRQTPLSALRLLLRSSSDGRRLKICCPQGDRDYSVSFASEEERDEFSVAVRLLCPDVAVEEEAMHTAAPHCYAFDVQLATRAGIRRRRVLAVDLSRGVLSCNSSRTSTDDKPLRIDGDSFLEPDPADCHRLVVKLGDPASPRARLDVSFPSAALRERFSVLFRAVRAGVDPASASSLDRVANPRPLRLRIRALTFNVGATLPPGGDDEDAVRALEDMLGAGQCDVCAVSLQEARNKEEWLDAIRRALCRGVAPEGEAGESPDAFVPVREVSLWGIVLGVYARRAVAWHISHVQSDTEATGLGQVLGNKGGVGVSLLYREHTSFAFVSSHLAAQSRRVKARAANYSSIVGGLNLGGGSGEGDVLHAADHVFWCGDVNYRVDLGHSGTEDDFRQAISLVEAGDYAELARHDQLIGEQLRGRAFVGFEEGPLTFPPTYRMLKGEAGYSNKKNQNPSYTDRILWRSRPGVASAVSLVRYGHHPDVQDSDHRPVTAQFAVKCRTPSADVRAATTPLLEMPRRHLAFLYMEFVADHAQQLARETELEQAEAIAAAVADTRGEEEGEEEAGSDTGGESESEDDAPVTPEGGSSGGDGAPGPGTAPRAASSGRGRRRRSMVDRIADAPSDVSRVRQAGHSAQSDLASPAVGEEEAEDEEPLVLIEVDEKEEEEEEEEEEGADDSGVSHDAEGGSIFKGVGAGEAGSAEEGVEAGPGGAHGHAGPMQPPQRNTAAAPPPQPRGRSGSPKRQRRLSTMVATRTEKALLSHVDRRTSRAAAFAAAQTIEAAAAAASIPRGSQVVVRLLSSHVMEGPAQSSAAVFGASSERQRALAIAFSQASADEAAGAMPSTPGSAAGGSNDGAEVALWAALSDVDELAPAEAGAQGTASRSKGFSASLGRSLRRSASMTSFFGVDSGGAEASPSAGEGAAGEPSAFWEDRGIPQVPLYPASVAMLREEHLLALVRCKQPGPIAQWRTVGQADIPLRPACAAGPGAAPSPFEVPVWLRGRRIGTLRGKFCMREVDLVGRKRGRIEALTDLAGWRERPVNRVLSMRDLRRGSTAVRSVLTALHEREQEQGEEAADGDSGPARREAQASPTGAGARTSTPSDLAASVSSTMLAIARRMLDPDVGLEVAPRRLRAGQEPVHAFVGTAFVDWMLVHHAFTRVCTRGEATELGQSMLEARLFRPVGEEPIFRDGFHFYTFEDTTGDSPTGRKALGSPTSPSQQRERSSIVFSTRAERGLARSLQLGPAVEETTQERWPRALVHSSGAGSNAPSHASSVRHAAAMRAARRRKFLPDELPGACAEISLYGNSVPSAPLPPPGVPPPSGEDHRRNNGAHSPSSSHSSSSGGDGPGEIMPPSDVSAKGERESSGPDAAWS